MPETRWSENKQNNNFYEGRPADPPPTPKKKQPFKLGLKLKENIYHNIEVGNNSEKKLKINITFYSRLVVEYFVTRP